MIMTNLDIIKKGILLLYNTQDMYAFDFGFDFYKNSNGEVILYIKKNVDLDVLGTSKITGSYPLFISVLDNTDNRLYNNYSFDLERYAKVGLHGAEKKIDKEIKKYFPKSEILQYINTGIDLQNKIVALYENNKWYNYAYILKNCCEKSVRLV